MHVLAMIETLYVKVRGELDALAQAYQRATSGIASARETDLAAIELRKENLKKQLADIEDYREKIKMYVEAAEKSLKSRNHSTIIARELDFNKLRNWAMMVGSADPDEHGDDPYARRIHYLCMCNLVYLDQKQGDFERRLKVLSGEAGQVDDDARSAELIERHRRDLARGYEDLLASPTFNAFKQALEVTQSGARSIVALGHELRQLPVLLPSSRDAFKHALGAAYDASAGTVRIPVVVDLSQESTIVVGYGPAKEKRVFSGVQRLLSGVVEGCLDERRKIVLLDAVHYNDTLLNSRLDLGSELDLRALRKTGLFLSQPRSEEQLVDALKLIVSSFEEIEEQLGMCESVAEHNAAAPFEKQIARQVLVLVGYPAFFSAEARSCVVRILSNQERYGLSVLILDGHFESRRGEGPEPPVDLPKNLYRIHLASRDVLRFDDWPEAPFEFARFDRLIPYATRDSVEKRYAAAELSNEYPRCVPELSSWPAYERGRKSIVLPYGVRADGKVSTISFDGENFAAYLMGASGSGKSTLLHNLITGIIGAYHPDDVELWLADFKMAEFSQYIDPMPPHVRYILLDESPELVFDLVDRLTEEMMDRQRFFMQHRAIKKVEDVPRELRHMPVIFVILDEFSIMSQAIADSPAYKLKLQNLLAKGRALGIKFLFSSQQFSTGTSGLSAAARAQVQSRIAMKNSRDEISQTLELSAASKTDKVRAWMEALPPHYALYKHREDDAVRVDRQLVLYFPGPAEDAFAPQRALIERVRGALRPVDAYDPSDDATYVDKHPIVVDGNSYVAFDAQRISSVFSARREAASGELVESDVLLCLGSPRRLCETRLQTLSSVSRDNLLLLAPPAEQACALSMVLSTMASFALQGRKVSVWAYERNRLYRALSGCGAPARETREGIDAVCDAIRDLRGRIEAKAASSELIVLMGIESICADFELMGEAPAARPEPGRATAEAPATAVYAAGDPAADARQALAEEWVRVSRDRRRELRTKGLSREQIKEQLAEEMRAFYAERGLSMGQGAAPAQAVAPAPPAPAPAPATPEQQEAPGGAYNARADFQYVLRQGSRLGYHFMLCLSSLADLPQTFTKADLYRTRIAFQTSVEDSRALFSSRVASTLPPHICQLDDGTDRFSMRPYLHRGVGWDGWYVDEELGTAVNSFDL